MAKPGKFDRCLPLSGRGNAKSLLHQRRRWWPCRPGRVLWLLEKWADQPWLAKPHLVFETGGCCEYCNPIADAEELTGLLIDLARHLPKKDRKTLHRRLAAIADAW